MCCVIRSVWKRVVLPWLHPLIKKVFRMLFIKKNKLLAKRESKDKEWVLVYGACTKVGKLTAKVFAQVGCSLLLVDADLSKLQQ